MLSISRIPFRLNRGSFLRIDGHYVRQIKKVVNLFFGGYVMKKRLVAYLMVSALAVTVLAGCGSKGDAAGDAADAATGEAAVEEDAFVEEDDASAALTAAIEEAAAVADTGDAAVADTGDAVAAVADTAAEAAEEYVDDEVITDAATAAKAAVEDVAEKAEEFVAEPGTYYTVQWGGNVFGTPDESTPVIDEVYPDYQLLITERLDNYWYKVSYQILGENEPRTGYIKIQH